MLVTDDFKELAAIEWEILVVDEAHRKCCACVYTLREITSQRLTSLLHKLISRLEEPQLKVGKESTRR